MYNILESKRQQHNGVCCDSQEMRKKQREKPLDLCSCCEMAYNTQKMKADEVLSFFSLSALFIASATEDEFGEWIWTGRNNDKEDWGLKVLVPYSKIVKRTEKKLYTKASWMRILGRC